MILYNYFPTDCKRLAEKQGLSWILIYFRNYIVPKYKLQLDYEIFCNEDKNYNLIAYLVKLLK